MSHKIHFKVLDDGSVAGSLKGEGRAPGNVFSAQLGAFKSAGFRWAGGAWSGPRAKLLPIIETLSDAGITSVLPEVLEADIKSAPDNFVPDLPEGFKLFAHQNEGISWLRLRASRGKGSLLADDMGLGKTAQTLLSIENHAPVLVVAPSVAKGVWVRETKLWRPGMKAEALSGRGSFRWPAPGEMVVTNFDILPKATKGNGRFPELPAELSASLPPGLIVIVDEAHKVKNPKAQRTQSLRAICSLSRRVGGYTVLLTGTPVLNNPQEAWTILVAADLHREAFPGGWEQFAELAGGIMGQYGMEWHPHLVQTEALAERLAKVQLRRRKDDVLDLPGKIHERLTVDIPTVAAADKALKQIGDISTADLSALARDIDFQTMSKAREALARAKVKAAENFINDLEEAGEGPLVVFSAHAAPVEHFAQREGWAKITGDVTSEERTRIEEDFQAGKLKGIAATIRSTGVALTLTAAARVVFIDEDWTPGNNEQAEDRCYRIGQTRSVVVTTLVADHPLDERVADLLARKNEFVSKSTEAAADARSGAPEPQALLVEIERPAPTQAAPQAPERTPAVPFTDVEREMPRPFEPGNGTVGNGEPKPITEQDITDWKQLLSTKAMGATCFRCGRPLRDAVSQEMGIGPTCRTKLGIEVDPDLAVGRAEANVLIWAMLDAPLDRRLDVDRGCDRLEKLGFGSATTLRERFRKVLDDEREALAKIPTKVTIKVNQNRDWVVVTPYNRDAVAGFQAIPGRKWNGSANVIPRKEAEALHELLKKHWAGEMCEGARGQRFVI